MSTRIRYYKTETPNVVTSVRLFQNGPDSYRIKINNENNTFEIQNVGTAQVVATGNGTSYNNVRLRAKEALVKLGVKFENESRVREAATANEATVNQ